SNKNNNKVGDNPAQIRTDNLSSPRHIRIATATGVRYSNLRKPVEMDPAYHYQGVAQPGRYAHSMASISHPIPPFNAQPRPYTQNMAPHPGCPAPHYYQAPPFLAPRQYYPASPADHQASNSYPMMPQFSAAFPGGGARYHADQELGYYYPGIARHGKYAQPMAAPAYYPWPPPSYPAPTPYYQGQNLYYPLSASCYQAPNVYHQPAPPSYQPPPPVHQPPAPKKGLHSATFTVAEALHRADQELWYMNYLHTSITHEHDLQKFFFQRAIESKQLWRQWDIYYIVQSARKAKVLRDLRRNFKNPDRNDFIFRVFRYRLEKSARQVNKRLAKAITNRDHFA
ncbi:hypothetical protein B0H63DRAFT_551386, partial [Podospora didyma]